MEYKRSGNTYIIRIDRGEEIIEKLLAVVKKENIKLAHVEAIGACDYVKVGLFDVIEQKYHSKGTVNQCESGDASPDSLDFQIQHF